MKVLIYFLLISAALHTILFFINIKQPELKKDITPIEILRENRTVPPTEIIPVPEAPELPAPPEEIVPEVIPPKEIIPDTPAPDEDVPVLATEDRNLAPPPPEEPIAAPKPDNEKGPEPETSRPIVTPQPPDMNNLPPPMSLDEFLTERARQSEAMGPDRSIRDILTDFLNEQETAPGEDSVSFNKMSLRYDSYFYTFSRVLYGVWQYPAESARRGESGIVRVTFSITRDGRITNISIMESSGYPALDREVLRTLKTMQGVPLPKSFELDVMHINGYFIYSLDGRYRVY